MQNIFLKGIYGTDSGNRTYEDEKRTLRSLINVDVKACFSREYREKKMGTQLMNMRSEF